MGNNDLKQKNKESDSKFEQLELRFCEAKLKQHYSKEDTSIRHKLESELAEQTAKCDQANYAQLLAERKLEFLSEQLNETKASLEKDRADKQQLIEENQLLQAEVAALKKSSQQLQANLLVNSMKKRLNYKFFMNLKYPYLFCHTRMKNLA